MAHSSTPQPNKLLRLKDVIPLVSLSKSTIYVGMKTGDFPASVKLSSRAIGFYSSDIHQWIDDRKRK